MSPSDPPPTTYATIRDAARGVLLITLLALALATVVHFCSGCGVRPPAERSAPMTAEQSAIVSMYAAELAECRARGKAAKSFAVYEDCADEVDRRYGR